MNEVIKGIFEVLDGQNRLNKTQDRVNEITKERFDTLEESANVSSLVLIMSVISFVIIP